MKRTLCESGGCLPTRAVVAVMSFLACFICYMMRVNMSINIIAMVEPLSATDGNQSAKHSVAECLLDAGNETFIDGGESLFKLTLLPDYGPRYEWDSKTQGLILGSYFWGYVLMSIPGGLLAERFGPTYTIGITGFASAALTALTPFAAAWHYYAVLAVRFLLGLMGGVVYPALHCLVSKWAPPVEKGKFIGALMGGTLGTMLTWPALGSVIEFWGWKWAFYGPGLVALVWGCLWMYFVRDSPECHSRISQEEKTYIVNSLGDVSSKTKVLPPYLKLFTSVPFWALTVLHFGNSWGLFFLLTNGPKYISEVLGFNVGRSGILASLPHLARILFAFAFGYVGDTIRKNKWLSVTTTRKSFVTFSHFIPGLLLFALTLAGCDATLSMILITLSLGINGASTITNLQNNQDLAPNFAGSIYGIINCFASTTGFITPAITGYITAEKSGLHEWKIIFWIGASIYIATGVVFCCFGSGEQQSWNKIPEKPEKAAGKENPAFNFSEAEEAITENTKV